MARRSLYPAAGDTCDFVGGTFMQALLMLHAENAGVWLGDSRVLECPMRHWHFAKGFDARYRNYVRCWNEQMEALGIRGHPRRMSSGASMPIIYHWDPPQGSPNAGTRFEPPA